MVTEYGAIKTETAYDKKLFKQLNASGFIFTAILIVLSAVGIALGFWFYFRDSTVDVLNIILLVCFFFIFIFSVFLLAIRIVAYKNNIKGNKRNVAELYAEYAFVCEYDGDKQISQNKIYYKNLYRRAETKFFFLIYIAPNAVLPVSKEGLSPAELNGVRRLLSLPQVAGADRFVPESSLHAETVCTAATEEVFEDFPENDGVEK